MPGHNARRRDAILIDHDFLRRLARAGGRQHEMSAFKAYFQEAARADGCFAPQIDYFLAWFDDGGDERPAILRYADWLAYNGFKLHLKEFHPPENGSDAPRVPDFNVEIAVAALTAGRWARRVVIVSDKHALAPALEALRNEGVIIAVAGLEETRALRRVCDEHIDLAAIPGFIRTDQTPEA